jgi:hypothetical protein
VSEGTELLTDRAAQVYKESVVARLLAEEILEESRENVEIVKRQQAPSVDQLQNTMERRRYLEGRVIERRSELAEAMVLEEAARARLWDWTMRRLRERTSAQ